MREMDFNFFKNTAFDLLNLLLTMRVHKGRKSVLPNAHLANPTCLLITKDPEPRLGGHNSSETWG